MGGHSQCVWKLSAVLMVTFVLPVCCQSPCGNPTLSVSIPEYPGISSAQGFPIPTREQANYRAILVTTTKSNLQLTLRASAKTPGLNPDNIFRLEWLPLAIQGWYLTMIRGFDRDGALVASDDDQNTLEFELECSDPTVLNNGVVVVSFHNILVQLTDVNDNAPQFAQSGYSISVNELTPVGLTVFRAISATDLDKGNNKLIEYTMNSAGGALFNGQDFFRLPTPDNAIVVLNRPLDYEAMLRQTGSPSLCLYNMNVTATDRPSTFAPKSSWVYFNITITDGDDRGPVFIYPSCPVSPYKSCVQAKYDASIVTGTTGQLTFLPVPRITGNPTQTVVIRARDGDALNEAVNCSIARTNPSGFEGRFQTTATQIGTTNEYQCNIQVIQAISRTEATSMEVVVQATERTFNAYTEEASITLTITPSNLFAPQLSTNSGGNTTYIREGSSASTAASTTTLLNETFRFIVTDSDVGPSDSAQYEIVLNPATTFSVDSNGFVRLITPPLDYEGQRVYTYTVTVRETNTAERQSSTTTLTVSVLDVNDNAPRANSYLLSVSLPEGDYSQPAGRQFLVNLGATDADLTSPNNVLSYTLTSVQPSAGTSKFAVDNIGNVYLQGVVTAGEVYVLQTTVSDGGSPSLSTNIAVHVRITKTGNTAPHFPVSEFTVYVSSNVPVRTRIWTIPVVESDNDPLDFEITSSVPQARVFETFKDPVLGGILRTRQRLHPETDPVFHLTIQVSETSNSQNFATATVTVSILDFLVG